MTKEQIYNSVCDVAEDLGISPGELITQLMNQNEAMFEQSLGDLSETATDYVKKTRAEKNAMRETMREAEQETVLAEEIKRFRQLFPDTDAKSIPDSVWADMENGIPLTYAYALFALTGKTNEEYARSVNARNNQAAMPAVVEGADEGEVSMDEVENMSTAAIKKNFPKILHSISKWKLQ